MAAADVGIALGTGTDLAKAVADVVIASGDLRGVPAPPAGPRDALGHPPEPVLGLRLQHRRHSSGRPRPLRHLRADDRRPGHVAQLRHGRRASSLLAGLDLDSDPSRRESGPGPAEDRPSDSQHHQSGIKEFASMITPSPTAERVVSLDQFRGYTVAGMILVNFLGDYHSVPAWLKHHNTYNSYPDTIMPQFFFAVGFAYRLTFLKRREREGTEAAFAGVTRRCLGLILLGVVSITSTEV
ncbi:MAG: heparan-alpha-glucosaminide N-acetyltransferase domain-containing protein [Singulisphaera sp.]